MGQPVLWTYQGAASTSCMLTSTAKHLELPCTHGLQFYVFCSYLGDGEAASTAHSPVQALELFKGAVCSVTGVLRMHLALYKPCCINLAGPGLPL